MQSIVVTRPVEEVFDFMTGDTVNWTPKKIVRHSGGPTELGATYQDASGFDLASNTYHKASYEVVEYVVDKKIVVQLKSLQWVVESKFEILLEPLTCGTRIDLIWESRLRGLFKVLNLNPFWHLNILLDTMRVRRRLSWLKKQLEQT